MATVPSDLTPPPASGADGLVARAFELSRSGGGPQAVDDLLAAASERRHDLESARDQVATRVHERVDDFEATAALQLLNRTLSRAPIHDPLDWKVRWGQRFRRP